MSTAHTDRKIPGSVLEILVCPSCRSALKEDENGLRCSGCGSFFPRINGLIRFVDTQKYAGTFGFQWKKFALTQMDSASSHMSDMDFRRRTGFTPEDLAGKLVLDVGCGMGRFAELASRWGARVVGVDLSLAAEVAAHNLADRESVTIFQADVFSLPFAPESFDIIYSLGVLHHTPNCEQAFKLLPRLLKPGGVIALWVYSAYTHWYRFSDIYRKLTHRLPEPWLHALCQIARPLYYVHSGLRMIPVIGRPTSGLIRYLLPTSLDPNPEARVLDTFDWYSPKYQSKHTYEEVFRWFEDCGLESLRVLHEPIAVTGRKPLRSAVSDSSVGRLEPRMALR